MVFALRAVLRYCPPVDTLHTDNLQRIPVVSHDCFRARNPPLASETDMAFHASVECFDSVLSWSLTVSGPDRTSWLFLLPFLLVALVADWKGSVNIHQFTIECGTGAVMFMSHRVSLSCNDQVIFLFLILFLLKSCNILLLSFLIVLLSCL